MVEVLTSQVVLSGTLYYTLCIMYNVQKQCIVYTVYIVNNVYAEKNLLQCMLCI